MAKLMPIIKHRFVDSNGEALAGGKLYSYIAGTNTPLATYTDDTEGTANTNPVILDANGEADIWVADAYYKFVLKDADDVTIHTVDNVTTVEAVLAGAVTAKVAAEAAQAAAAASASAAATSATASATSATASAASATTAGSAATSASASATSAAASSSSATTAASNASTSATASATSATASATSATASAASATAAAASAVAAAQSAAEADGDVSGPASATDNGFALFDGTTGKLLKNSAAIVPLAKGGTGQATKAPAFDALSPMSASGDLIYGGASGTGTRLAKELDGQRLRLVSGVPAWAFGPVSSVKTTTYPIVASDETILVSGASGSFTTTLPTAVGYAGKVFCIKRTDQTLANAVTIATTSSQTIDGVTTRKLMTQFEEFTVISDGANWHVVSHTYPTGPISFSFGGSWTGSYSGFWSRTGKFTSLDMRLAVTSASGGLTLNLPTGLTIDTAAMTTPGAGLTALNGHASLGETGTNNWNGVLRYNNTTSIAVRGDTGLGTNSNTSSTLPFTWDNTDIVVVKVSGIPITDWEA